jgi:hypothetical protein
MATLQADNSLEELGPVCGNCRYWFVFQSPPPDHPPQHKPCNHPSCGGKGLAPLKSFRDTCGKHELRVCRRAQ